MNVFELLATDMGKATAQFVIQRDANGEPLVWLDVVGANSPQYLAEKERQRQESMQIARDANKDPVLKAKLDRSTPEGQEYHRQRFAANMRAFATACVTGWGGFTDQGAPLAFDHGLVVQLFEKMPTWQDGVVALIDDDSRFLPQVSEGSGSTSGTGHGSTQPAKARKASAQPRA